MTKQIELNWKQWLHLLKVEFFLKLDPVKGEEGSKARLDNYVWQADLWLKLPAAPTAGWQVRLRKHSPPHLSVVFDLILPSTVKSVWPTAESHGSLLDESSSVRIYLCRCMRARRVIGLYHPLSSLFDIPECHSTWEDWGLGKVSSQMTRPSVPRIEL